MYDEEQRELANEIAQQLNGLSVSQALDVLESVKRVIKDKTVINFDIDTSSPARL